MPWVCTINQTMTDAIPESLTSSGSLRADVGSLTVYTGPMFCGKTTALLDDVAHFVGVTKDPNSVLLVNHSRDNRNPLDAISSHSPNFKLLEKVRVIQTDDLSTVDASAYTVIGIDEACFFGLPMSSDEPEYSTRALITPIENWLNQGKHIICAGLDGSFEMKKFGYLADLLPLADTFIKMSAVCNACMDILRSQGITITPKVFVPAPFTTRLGSNTALIDIGGEGKYVATCRRHRKRTLSQSK